MLYDRVEFDFEFSLVKTAASELRSFCSKFSLFARQLAQSAHVDAGEETRQYYASQEESANMPSDKRMRFITRILHSETKHSA
jgi:uncharacterized protein YbcV (DUF1398 family)